MVLLLSVILIGIGVGGPFLIDAKINQGLRKCKPKQRLA
jgi:hypothetical protein